MSDAQAQMLIVALAESLIPLAIVFVVAYWAVSSLLKPPKKMLRGFMAFGFAWLLVGFALPFKSVRYYDDHRGELWLILLVASVITSVAVCKLQVRKAAGGEVNSKPSKRSAGPSST